MWSGGAYYNIKPLVPASSQTEQTPNKNGVVPGVKSDLTRGCGCDVILQGWNRGGRRTIITFILVPVKGLNYIIKGTKLSNLNRGGGIL